MKNEKKLEKIWEMIESLLKTCDNARSIDGKGFNKYDSETVRNFYYKYRKRNIETKNADYLRKIIKKYHKQLSNLGHDPSILEESFDFTCKYVDTITNHEFVNGNLILRTPHNQEFYNKMKNINGCIYSREYGGYIITPSFKNENINKIEDLVLKYFNYVLTRNELEGMKNLGLFGINLDENNAYLYVYDIDTTDKKLMKYFNNKEYIFLYNKKENKCDFKKRVIKHWRLNVLTDDNEYKKVAKEVIDQIEQFRKEMNNIGLKQQGNMSLNAILQKIKRQYENRIGESFTNNDTEEKTDKKLDKKQFSVKNKKEITNEDLEINDFEDLIDNYDD